MTIPTSTPAPGRPPASAGPPSQHQRAPCDHRGAGVIYGLMPRLHRLRHRLLARLASGVRRR